MVPEISCVRGSALLRTGWKSWKRSSWADISSRWATIRLAVEPSRGRCSDIYCALPPSSSRCLSPRCALFVHLVPLLSRAALRLRTAPSVSCAIACASVVRGIIATVFSLSPFPPSLFLGLRGPGCLLGVPYTLERHSRRLAPQKLRSVGSKVSRGTVWRPLDRSRGRPRILRSERAFVARNVGGKRKKTEHRRRRIMSTLCANRVAGNRERRNNYESRSRRYRRLPKSNRERVGIVRDSRL